MRERHRFENEIATLSGLPIRLVAAQDYFGRFHEITQVRERDHELDASQGKTIYLPIQLNKTVPPKVGIFIPSSFQPSNAIDLIVYFHGHIIRKCETYPKEFNKKGIEYYWNTPLFKSLREDLVTSGQKAILIAPTLMTIFASKNNSPHDYGDLNKAGKFDFLINETLTQLQKSGELTADAQVRNIILSGHSGGGLPMQAILNTNNSLKKNIVECWGFECLYFGIFAWERWLKANPSYYFCHFRRKKVFISPTNTLKKYTNFIDVKNGTSHCRIVKEKWRQAIDSSYVFQGGGKSPISSPDHILFESLEDEKFSLTEWKLATGKIIVARAGDKKKGTAVSITEAPAVFLPEIIVMARDWAIKDKKNALADKLDPATWFKEFTRITFLGKLLKKEQHLHLEMAKLLKAIESVMIKKYSMNAKSVGDMLLNKSDEGISGSRLVSSTATFSMHMFGLAIDVNYLGNPFIQKGAILKLNTILKNAALLMNEPTLVYKDGQGFDSVQKIDTILEKYFSLLDSPEELERLIVEASLSSEWGGLSMADAKKKIQNNLDNLAGLLARGGEKKDYFKKHAILNFDKRFVQQMEESGLHWGGHYGDMMHFDMRTTGVGKYINKARLAYSKKVKGLAQRLFKEKKYGIHLATTTS